MQLFYRTHFTRSLIKSTRFSYVLWAYVLLACTFYVNKIHMAVNYWHKINTNVAIKSSLLEFVTSLTKNRFKLSKCFSLSTNWFFSARNGIFLNQNLRFNHIWDNFIFNSASMLKWIHLTLFQAMLDRNHSLICLVICALL